MHQLSLLVAVFALAVAVVSVSGKPAVLAAYSAPVVAAAPVVTATSSQFIARNHNGIAAAPVVAAAYTAPVAAAYTAPIAAAYTAPIAAAYTAPAVAASYASYYPYSAAYPAVF